MRNLTIFVLVLAALYSGYWFVGSRAVENGAQAAIADLQNQGWIVEIEDVSTRGFPSRFDTTATDILLVSPGDGFSYRAPFLQAFALSYAPNSVIAALPNEQKVRLGLQTIDVASEGLKASAKVEASTSAELEDLTLESGPIQLSSDFGWNTGASKLISAVRQTSGVENTYDVYFDVDELMLPDAINQMIGSEAGLPASFDTIELDLRTKLDKPLDRFVAEQNAEPPRPETIELRRLTANWGDATIEGRGDLEIGAEGTPEGRITLNVRSWDKLISALVSLGLIQEGIAPTVQNVADTMAQGGDTLSVPISFQNGFMSVGPLPLGPAPKFF